MNPKTVLITGANRGIGLEFVKQFLKLQEPPLQIYAACRSPEKAQVSGCAHSINITIITTHCAN